MGLGQGQPAGKVPIWSAINKSDLQGQLQKEKEAGALRVCGALLRPRQSKPILTWGAVCTEPQKDKGLWDKGRDPHIVTFLPDSF